MSVPRWKRTQTRSGHGPKGFVTTLWSWHRNRCSDGYHQDGDQFRLQHCSVTMSPHDERAAEAPVLLIAGNPLYIDSKCLSTSSPTSLCPASL